MRRLRLALGIKVNADLNELPADVSKKLEADFGPDDMATVRNLLAEYKGKESPRVIRCILHLAEGDTNKLLHFINAANSDYRDVIYWAEYDKGDQRAHDFNLPL